MRAAGLAGAAFWCVAKSWVGRVSFGAVIHAKRAADIVRACAGDGEQIVVNLVQT